MGGKVLAISDDLTGAVTETPEPSKFVLLGSGFLVALVQFDAALAQSKRYSLPERPSAFCVGPFLLLESPLGQATEHSLVSSRIKS